METSESRWGEEVLEYQPSFQREVLRQCARGEREYCHVADTSARPPRRCAYRLRNGARIVVDELGVAAGGVGWRVSVGALCLADWIVSRQTFAERSVLELGSGLGVSGLAAASAGASRVCLTDALPSLVSNLQTIIETDANARLAAGGCALEARVLDWWDGPQDTPRCTTHVSMEEHVLRAGADGDAPPPPPTLPPADTFDLVIAAEACYERYHASALPRTIAKRLRRNEPSARAYVLQAVREEQPFCAGGGGLFAGMATSARAEGLVLTATAPRTPGIRCPLRLTFHPKEPRPDLEAWRAAISGTRLGLLMLEFRWPETTASPRGRS
jgi:predicted nicotinamide N-methyase